MKKFHFSSYWQSWSRVIYESCGYYVEVALTPILGHSWEMVNQITIYAHHTRRGRGDVETDVLPQEVRDRIVANAHLEGVSVRLTPQGKPDYLTYLLTEDFLSQIDWEKFNRNNNGGAPLHLVRK